MDISVVICTWNRANFLASTLSQLCLLQIPGNLSWELIIVNNNCTDDTDEIINKFKSTLPVSRLFEERAGLSNARNKALQHAAGDLIVWTDDDVLVGNNWLNAYSLAAEKWPDAAYFGGNISPNFEVSPPQWIVDNITMLDGLLVVKDFGSEERILKPKEHPFGANMAFRKDVLSRYHFDPNLGRNANSPILGEETKLMQQLVADGYVGVAVPDAEVKHFIPSERMELSYFVNYFRGRGATDVRNGKYGKHPQLLGDARWLIRRYASLKFQSYLTRITRSSNRISKLGEVSVVEGILMEILRSGRNDLT